MGGIVLWVELEQILQLKDGFSLQFLVLLVIRSFTQPIV